MKKFIFILSVGLIATMGLFFYFNQSSSPLNNPEAYAKETNEWMAEKLAAQEMAKNSPDHAQKKERFLEQWEKTVDYQESKLKRINFYGLVVDQDNNPVPEVLINYDLGGKYLAPGSGQGQITTDDKGKFNIDDGKGFNIYFRNMSKPGYQYRFSKDGGTSVPFYNINNKEWDGTSKKNPYIFKLWRIDRYPEVLKSRGSIEAKPEEKDHTLDFMDRTKPLVLKGLQDGDLQITIDKTKLDENGVVKIAAVNGGLQETDDLYPFRAPEDGYVPELEYKLLYSPQFKDFEELVKNFYFTSRNGEVFGYIEMEVHPNWNEDYAVFLKYVVNKEKGRDLLVKE
jgi:hypothetical protein